LYQATVTVDSATTISTPIAATAAHRRRMFRSGLPAVVSITGPW
jgi:hypothetical protein